MDFDLNRRAGKLKLEQEKRKQIAKQKAEAKSRAEAKAKQAALQIEQERENRRLQDLRRLEALEELRLEEERLTGGIKYNASLVPFPTPDIGDRVRLPASALEQLDPQDALSGIPMTFELLHRAGKTHCGVVEFTAQEGTIGLPARVAFSLAMSSACKRSELGSISIRYRKLPRGKFARFQPLGTGFKQNDLDMEEILSRALKGHFTLTVGDLVPVRYTGQTIWLVVQELRPESQVSLVDTDLEVEVAVSEAAQRYQESEIRKKELELRGLERSNRRKEEIAHNRYNKARMLETELQTERDDRDMKLQIRFPNGSSISRPFSASQLMETVFAAVEGSDKVDVLPGEYRLVARFPTRIFTKEDSLKTLEQAGLTGRQETLLFEQIAAQPSKEETEPDSMNTDDENLPLQNAVSHLSETSVSAWQISEAKMEADLDMVNEGTESVMPGLEPVSIRNANLPPRQKWASFLTDLSDMGFNNEELNIQILEKYQGRMLRVINYLSDLAE